MLIGQNIVVTNPFEDIYEDSVWTKTRSPFTMILQSSGKPLLFKYISDYCLSLIPLKKLLLDRGESQICKRTGLDSQASCVKS